jgi:hypothetical protein
MLEVTYAVKSTPGFIGKPVDERKCGCVCEEPDKRGYHWVIPTAPVTDEVLETLNAREMAQLCETGRVVKYFYGLEITITKSKGE